MISIESLVGKDPVFATTDRLVLKRVSAEDRNDYLRVNAFMSIGLGDDRKKFEDACWERVCNGPDIMFSIFEKATGDYAGNCQYILGNPELIELGITLDEAFQHKGYGYEVSSALVVAALNRTPVPFVVWRARRMNKASQRLAEHLGGILVEVKPAFGSDEGHQIENKSVSNPLLDVLTYHIERIGSYGTV